MPNFMAMDVEGAYQFISVLPTEAKAGTARGV
jgi:hypothetical protein